MSASDVGISIEKVVFDLVDYINKKGECTSDGSFQINTKRLQGFYKVNSRRKEVIRKQARKKKGQCVLVLLLSFLHVQLPDVNCQLAVGSWQL